MRFFGRRQRGEEYRIDVICLAVFIQNKSTRLQETKEGIERYKLRY